MISNVELRNQLVFHYNFEQPKIQPQLDINQNLSESFIEYTFDRLNNPISDSFSDSFNYTSEVLIPIDYTSLINDNIYLSKLHNSIKTRYRLNQMVKEFIEKEVVLIEAVDQALDGLSNF